MGKNAQESTRKRYPLPLYDRHPGKGQFFKTNAGDLNHKERFTRTETIGIYRSEYTGKTVRGKWIDCLDAENAGEDERQEDSILIQNGDKLIEVYESEIKAIQKAHIRA